jgi:hypothetical protein
MSTAANMQSTSIVAAAVPAVAASAPAVATVALLDHIDIYLKVGAGLLILAQIAYYVIKAYRAAKDKTSD